MIIRELSAIFNFKYNPDGIKRATTALDNFASKANMVLGAIAGHYAVNAFFTAAQNIGLALDKIGKSSQNLGISPESFQELSYAAQKSGIQLENFEESFKELMLRSRDALAGGGDAAEGFKALGISVKDASGHMREPIGLLEEVADKVKNMPTQSDKIWALDKLFGDPGYRMLTMLDKGSLGLRAMREEARNLGIALESDAISRAKKFNEAFKDMKMSSDSFKNSLMASMMPALTKIMNGLKNLSAMFNQVENRASNLRVIFIGLGLVLTALAVKMAISFAPALLTMAPMLALVTAIGGACGALAVIAEDMWVGFFTGGDSVFKNLYDKAAYFFMAVKNWFSNLIPDFIKNAFKADIKLSESAFKLPADSRVFSPNQVSNLNQSSLSNQNNVSVAVNVKSGANPQEIGSEVSQAVRRELERERANAFMGVSQYAL